MSLQQEIESSFGDGPAHRPVEDRLAAGRAAVRRRRVTGAVAAGAVVAVLGATFAVAAPGADRPGGEVATDPTTDAGPTQAPKVKQEPQDQLIGDAPAELTPDGLVLRDGARVIRQVTNPMGHTSPQKQSLGLVVEHDGRRYWMLLESDPRGASSVYDDAGRTFPTFDLWLADMVALQKGEPLLALVAFDQGETLVPEDGVEILDQRPSPDMPEGFAGPDDRTAVAMVRWQGERWFVLARQTDPMAAAASGQPESPPQYCRPRPRSSVTRPPSTRSSRWLPGSYASEQGLR